MTTNITLLDFGMLIPLIIIFITSLVPITLKIFRYNQEFRPGITLSLAASGILTALLFANFQVALEPTFAFSQALFFNGVTTLTNIILLLVALFVLMFSLDHPGIDKRQFSEHVFLTLSSIIGMFVICYSNDLILAFIGIELMSLPLYVLIGMGGHDKYSKESAFKYFILGSFASAFILYGIALIYGATQTTQIHEIMTQDILIEKPLFLMGMGLFFVGLLFKVAVVPFHSWLPDVYQGAPTPVTTLMATGVKVTMFLFVLKFVRLQEMVDADSLATCFEWLAIITMFWGSLAALQQKYLKRLIAYSSIAHSGYLFMGVVAAIKGNYLQAHLGVFSYLIVYLFMSLGAFGLISLFEKREDTRLTLDDFKGLSKKYPLLSACFAIFMFSLAGIPPLGGFFVKLFLFSAAVDAGLYWLVVWGVLSSVVAVYYYLKPIVYMYMYECEKELQTNSKHFGPAAIFVCAAFVLFAGFAAESIFERVREAFMY